MTRYQTVKVEKPTAITVAVKSPQTVNVERPTASTVSVTGHQTVKVEKQTANAVAVTSPQCNTDHKIEHSEYEYEIANFMGSLQVPSVSSITKNQVKRNQEVNYSENKKAKLSYSSNKENTAPIVQNVLPTDQLPNSSQIRLIKQMASVNIEELFQCEFCSMIFSQKWSLVRHVTSFHEMLL